MKTGKEAFDFIVGAYILTVVVIAVAAFELIHCMITGHL